MSEYGAKDISALVQPDRAAPDDERKASVVGQIRAAKTAPKVPEEKPPQEHKKTKGDLER